MEDYKKKYEDALNAARRFKNDCPSLWDTESNPFRNVFEELKEESKDERLRKEIICYLNKQIALSDFGGDIASFEEWIAWLEKQGEQKPSDEFKSKFKVGDWCIDEKDGTIFQIVKVLDNTYTYKTNEGYEYSCTHYSLENDTKLWTIQDAKDGDVLANENGIPFIFNGFLEKITVGAHCGITGGIFCIPREKNIWATRNVLPATKEQRNLLFQKMKEDGYEWDAEKKELKKIEQKPAWSEEDEETLNNILNDLRQDVIPDDEDIQWLKSIKKRVRPQPKFVWSEEDERIFTLCSLSVKTRYNDGLLTHHEYKLVTLWLESLRDRMKGE